MRGGFHADFAGRLVMVGFGSIGQGVLPLLLRHVRMTPSQITIVTAEERGRAEAEAMGVAFVVEPLARENYARVLEPLLGAGDFLLNVSVEVSSLALIELCQRARRALSRHLHRALAGRLYRSRALAVAALELCAARAARWRCAAAIPAARPRC